MSKNRTWLSHGMLYEFKGWLVMNGWKLEKPVGKYEVLRARHYLKERPLLVYNRTSGGCGYSIDMRDKDVFEEYHEYRENLGKPSIHAVPQLMETIKLLMIQRVGSWLELRWYRLTVKRLRLIHTIDVLMEK